MITKTPRLVVGRAWRRSRRRLDVGPSRDQPSDRAGTRSRGSGPSSRPSTLLEVLLVGCGAGDAARADLGRDGRAVDELEAHLDDLLEDDRAHDAAIGALEREGVGGPRVRALEHDRPVRAADAEDGTRERGVVGVERRAEDVALRDAVVPGARGIDDQVHPAVDEHLARELALRELGQRHEVDHALPDRCPKPCILLRSLSARTASATSSELMPRQMPPTTTLHVAFANARM